MPERQVWFAIPGDLDSLTGGYLYDKRLITELRGLGWSVKHLAWPSSFPFPTARDLRVAGDSLAACPDGARVLIDGLAFGAMPDIAAHEVDRLRLAALVHHPLALETGLSTEDCKRFIDLERRALRNARAVIVTSDTTAATLVSGYGVDRGRITVAKPGVDRPELPAAIRVGASIRLLSVGSVTPRKGFDILVDALARIADLDWSCLIVGSVERAPETAAALRRQIERLGLQDRIVLAGEFHDRPNHHPHLASPIKGEGHEKKSSSEALPLDGGGLGGGDLVASAFPTADALAPLYTNADVFVLPSRYEGYGMVFAEAITHGLPIVATQAGAIPELVPTSAGVLVPIDDPIALAEALRRVILEPDLRSSLAAGARAAAAQLPCWQDSAGLIASALSQLQR